MLSRCLLFLSCLISAHLSLSQESGKPRVPATKPPAVVSKDIVYVVGDVHSPVGVRMGDTAPTTDRWNLTEVEILSA